MDKNTSEELKVREGIMAAISLEVEKRKKEPKLIIYDFLYFILSFIFSRFHLLFGAYPLGVAFLSATPVRVWVSLLGTLVGAISRGKLGIIHAIISIIVVLLRVIISGGEVKNSEKAALFGESLILRVSASVIGAFIGAVYEMLLGGFSKTSLLYGLSACGLGAAFTIVFYGLFTSDVGFDEIIFSKAPVFEIKRRGKEEYLWIYFQCSVLILLFFISLALREYVVLGINFSFVFASFITLFAAKRFGAVKAVVIGFVSSFGVSASYSVSFALLGLGAGFFFGIAPLYAFLTGGGLLAAWSAYSGGLVGFLSVFPEFASAAALFFPLIKTLDREKGEKARENTDKCALNMITNLALAKRNESGCGVDKLAASLSAVSAMVTRFGKTDGEISREEIVDAMIKGAKSACASCAFFASCKEFNPAPCAEIIDDLSTNIYKNGRISRQDIRFLPDYCQNRERLFEAFSSASGVLIGEKIKSQRLGLVSENVEYVSKMINDVRLFDENCWQLDKTLSDKVQSKLYEVGLIDGVARVFGDRRKCFVIAGEDKLGDVISSKELRSAIEDVADVKLASPEFFRRGDVALMNVYNAPVFSVEFASSAYPAESSEISGDSTGSFVSDDGYFYSLISDGMGTGEAAKGASLFVFEFMKNVLSSSVSLNTALGILNEIVRNKSGECSATLDLYRFDLLSGEATFVKSGAAHSYVKRGDSLFRIRSETAPLGLMKNVDAEKIRIEIKPGDLVVMFSDGVAASPESSVWLPELLSRDFEGSIQEYADYILKEARKNSRAGDDATVSVAKVKMLK